ncbi:hypothetical protein HMPREF9163_02086 [Selenomonas sp. oral taxon 138 str. F0429]|nr:hypothetical protein HMPREF9163_02086 [Selenomonas sp. oral taxon 138 str. F0429]
MWTVFNFFEKIFPPPKSAAIPVSRANPVISRNYSENRTF